ncbi:phosphatase PAP2 family protein [Streptomyces oceani]|uniref:phosphatase PAP2 family protein n=1 Tax=Streptomyces oceani TaxID=1075402 RepID=UPI000872E55D|nr:phosphatase PAP2 family protein [Streptomyces oceani]
MEEALYREVTDFAHETPGWVHALAEVGTEAGLLLLAALLCAACLTDLRRTGAYGRAAALLTPAAVAVAYGLSELTKLLVREERPCRAVPDAAPSIAPCPGVGDWSFPSNHATLALGAATTLLLLRRAWGWLVLPVALLTAFSRVFIGVHYPHDVLAGGLLGSAVPALAAAFLVRPGARLLTRRGMPSAVGQVGDPYRPDRAYEDHGTVGERDGSGRPPA